ncbi:MAG: hypothetical protein KF831_10855 [Acidobacteria bacterium]|nr:hypothetical protein [Acidobacteriota bacterium]
MQTETEKTLVERVRSLSPEQQEKVLEFVSSLHQPKKTIWEKLDERLSKVPDEEFAELPADASSNLNHYLYGSPKK